MKVVINNCFGGFSISKKCAEFMAKKGHKQAKAELDKWKKDNEDIQYFLETGRWRNSKVRENLHIDAKYRGEAKFYGYGYVKGFSNGYKRDDSILVEAVEILKKEANGEHASLKVIEIPDGVEYTIEEYDGSEHIAEKHNTWS